MSADDFPHFLAAWQYLQNLDDTGRMTLVFGGMAVWMMGVFWLLRRVRQHDAETYQHIQKTSGGYDRYVLNHMIYRLTFFVWIRALRTITPALRTHVILLRLTGSLLVLSVLWQAGFLHDVHNLLHRQHTPVAVQSGVTAGKQEAQAWLESRRQGDKAYRLKHWQEAIAHYSEALHEHPGEPRTLYWRARAYAKTHDNAASLQDVLDLLAIQPDHFDAVRHADRLLMKKGDWQRIIGIWDRYLERKPDDARAWLERSGTHHRMGHKKRAIADLDKACQLGSQQACDFLDKVR